MFKSKKAKVASKAETEVTKGASMKLKVPHIDLDTIESKVTDILFEEAKGLVPDESIVDAAVDKLAVWLDGEISYGSGVVAKFVDAHDDAVIKWLLHLIAHRVYTELIDAMAFHPDPSVD